MSVNLGKADAVLAENEQVKGETFQPTERIKVTFSKFKDIPERTTYPGFQNTSWPCKTSFLSPKLQR